MGLRRGPWIAGAAREAGQRRLERLGLPIRASRRNGTRRVGRCHRNRRMNPESVRIRLEPLSVAFEVAQDAPLLPKLAGHGIEFPCGGEGICGGCGVRVLSGSLSVT